MMFFMKLHISVINCNAYKRPKHKNSQQRKCTYKKSIHTSGLREVFCKVIKLEVYRNQKRTNKQKQLKV